LLGNEAFLHNLIKVTKEIGSLESNQTSAPAKPKGFFLIFLCFGLCVSPLKRASGFEKGSPQHLQDDRNI